MNELRQILEKGSSSLCNGTMACPQNTAAFKLLLDGDESRAMQRFQRILADRPRDPDALAGLAICVAMTSGRFVSATKLAREAVRRAPRAPAGYLALGYIHLLGSKLEQGYRYLLKAEKLAPADVRVAAGLAFYNKSREPVIADLAPENPLNRFFGGLRNRLRPPLHRVLAVALVAGCVYFGGATLF